MEDLSSWIFFGSGQADEDVFGVVLNPAQTKMSSQEFLEKSTCLSEGNLLQRVRKGFWLIVLVSKKFCLFFSPMGHP